MISYLPDKNMPSYTETGGVRYGRSFWVATNFTWPFATLTAATDGVSIRISLGRLLIRTFVLERGQIKSIKKKRGLLGTGILIEHSNAAYPPFILFWTFRFETLKKQLESIGYSVVE